MPENGILSPENVRTTVVVTFALTLIALSLTFYNYVRLHQVANVVILLQQERADWQTTADQRLTALEKMEARVKGLEDKSTAPAMPASVADAPPAEAPK
jgi:hypothetical protein